ncbi:hypothetical protein SanaruYs_11820 [Chryseotalea sanaruensis]|uniref:Uncharacterized protein n=1 Tax=Chryseotalea sanaruensis TaxID=2482724 RepID=A0A401U7V1_9BACT|nr:hypothetical protein [Chryseotalea sanaruensis]GCC50963.1 hypothetical protein SanaruYs_11820 [Chryseotalea sanaruensis]
MQEFFKDKSAQVYYDAALNTLFLVYTGKVQNDQQFITINTAVLAAFTKLNTQKFVADIRKMGIISVASQNWVVANLLPGMVKHLNGKMLYHAQVVDPSEILSKVSGNNIKGRSSQVAEGFEVVQFSDTEKLTEYLGSVG